MIEKDRTSCPPQGIRTIGNGGQEVYICVACKIISLSDKQYMELGAQGVFITNCLHKLCNSNSIGSGQGIWCC